MPILRPLSSKDHKPVSISSAPNAGTTAPTALPESCPDRSRAVCRSRDFPPRRSPIARSSRCPRWPSPSIPWPRPASVARVTRSSPARGLRRGRTRSPGLPGLHTRCPTVGTFPDSSRHYVELREARTFAVNDLRALLHIITPPHRLPPHRASSVRALLQWPVAPPCQSAASPPSANAAADRPPPAPSSP